MGCWLVVGGARSSGDRAGALSGPGNEPVSGRLSADVVGHARYPDREGALETMVTYES
jgi:hypothetical protein